MVDFIETRLPDDIERGAQGGPQFSTSIFISASGREKRNSNWSQARRKYDISYGLQARVNPADTEDGFDRLLDFYHNMYGQAIGFRFRDWSDYQVGTFSAVTLDATNTGFFGYGDGTTTVFQAIKRRTLAGNDYDRLIKKIALDDTTSDPIIRVIDEAVELTRVASAPGAAQFSVDPNTGLITFGVAPLATGGSGPSGAHVLRWAGEFDTPVRFDVDLLQIEMQIAETGSIPPITLREVFT